MKEYILCTLTFLVVWLIGYIFGRYIFSRHRNGTIIVENSEDGQRERIRFVLDMDLDDIKLKKQLILKVEDETSQK